ncbi:MAG: hypothetical protein HUJ80_01395 [Firmicutes bacterium]|nr:hypothetical protein [Bacillota bacterium]
MTVKELIAAERRSTEEESKSLNELEYVQAEPTERIAANDQLFCTHGGAANVVPSGKTKSFLRQMLTNADRA